MMTVTQTNDTGSLPPNSPAAIFPKFSLLAKGEVVEVLVGQDKAIYKLYKELLVANSPYFATGLEDCGKGTSNKIDLANVDTRTFDVFVA